MTALEQEQAIAGLQARVDAILEAVRVGATPGIVAPDLGPVRVRLSGRLTRSAGTYRPGGDIAISTHYLATHGLGGADGVIRHELAHHVVRALYGRAARPHGREFHRIALALGADLKADAFVAPRTVYRYRCPTCGWEWQRGRKIGRGRRYSCRHCAPTYNERHRLIFQGRERVTGSG